MNIRHLAATAMLLLFTVGNAQAASFDLTSYRLQNDSIAIDLLADDGLLTATATVAADTVGAHGRGLGVIENGSSRGIEDAETLRIDFGQTVNLGELYLRNFGLRDAFQVDWQGGSAFFDDGTRARDEFRVLNLAQVNWVSITGEGDATNFFLAGLNNVTAVPLPAAIWFMLSALGLLAGARRSRQQRALANS